MMLLQRDLVDSSQRASMKIPEDWNHRTRVAAYRNWLRKDADAEYVWRIEAVEGPHRGTTIGIATEVPLIGPVGHGAGRTPCATGWLSWCPITLGNAEWQPRIGAWGNRIPSAAILTSDGEIWTIQHNTWSTR